MNQHGCPRRRGLGWLGAFPALASLMLLAAGCGPSSKPAPPADAPKDLAAPAVSVPSAPAAAGTALRASDPARRVLDEMVAAYRNAKSYSDHGYVQLDVKTPQREDNHKLPFSLAMVRPNQLRMDVYYASLACDGRALRGTVTGVPQLLSREAPPSLTMRSVYCDPLLTQSLSQGPAAGSVQLLLLVSDDPLGALLQTAEKTELLEPAPLGTFTCDRVAITGREGRAVLWIDRATRILRRVELPVEDIKRQLAEADGGLERAVITAELEGAEFDRPVDPQRFQLEAPPGAQVVKFLAPPEPAQLLSKKVPAFKFTDLAGKSVTPEAIAGRVAVLEFWGVNCPPCRESFPKLEQVYQKYKSNPKVTFLCVNVDPPDVKNEALTAMTKELGLTAPLYRETERQLADLFFCTGIPVTFLVGADGVVEDFEAGLNPDLEKALPEKLEKLLAGKHLYEEGVKEYQERMKKLEQVAMAGPEDSPPSSGEVRQELPETKIAPASAPKSFKFKSLWKTTEVKGPGNMLVVPRPGAPAQVFVVSQWRSVVELNAEGKIAATHELDLPASEAVSFLRTGQSGANRFFAGSAVGVQQVHVFDDAWKPVFHFPQDALENKHSGIFDALFADLAGPDKTILAVGYWGPVGVQGVSPEGKRLWSNRSMENVFRLAVTGPDAAGQRDLLCLNGRGTIVVLDAEGNRKEEVVIPGRAVQLLVGADVTGDGRPEYCGLAAQQIGVYVALGLDLRGKELWSYELPPGHPNMPVEQIVAGRLTSTPGGQWLLPSADGSIHILRPDGHLSDSFNYGAALSGLATVEWNGRPVLLVATADTVEALEVQP